MGKIDEDRPDLQDGSIYCSNLFTQPLLFSFASSMSKRIRGLLFSHPNDEALMLVPCRDVHTVGMRYRLDIAFIDKQGQVVESYRDVGPMRRMHSRQAVAVIERFSSCSTPWFAKGDRLAITCLQEVKE